MPSDDRTTSWGGRRSISPTAVAISRYDIDGHPFNVYDAGPRDGLVYVVLHGVGLSHRPYRSLVRQLMNHGRVIVLDLPGFGSTAKPSAALSVDEYARLIAVLVDRLNVTSYVAIGHSMGAQVALELTLQQHDRASHLVMIGPVTDSRRRTALQQGLALGRDSLLEPLSTNAIVFTDYVRCGPRWYFSEVAAMLAYPTYEKVSGLRRPFLVIRGANDPIADESWCTRLSESGNGAVVAIPGTRHLVAHAAAREVTDAIVEFVASTARIPSPPASAQQGSMGRPKS